MKYKATDKQITYCIPTKDNLRYLKMAIESIRTNSYYDHDIIVYIDSDNDGTETWLLANNIRYIKNTSLDPKGIAHAYNRCIEQSITPVVCMFHADMYMAKDFDYHVLSHLYPGKVVSATRVEPPLHPHGLEKIIHDFGMYPEDFNRKAFDLFVKEHNEHNHNKTTRGIFAPWVIFKNDIEKIKLHDEQFHSYHEDSDIFNRFILVGYDVVQVWESLVYHFTCRAGQFKDGVDKITTDISFHEMKKNSFRNYVRKWGSMIKNDTYQYPIIVPKYNLGFIVKNCTYDLLYSLEPWCTNIYIENSDLRAEYIYKEQQFTNTNLNNKVRLFGELEDNNHINDIYIKFDSTYLNDNNQKFIVLINEIIHNSGELGTMTWDIFEINILKLKHMEN